jgi:hypothetical protein
LFSLPAQAVLKVTKKVVCQRKNVRSRKYMDTIVQLEIQSAAIQSQQERINRLRLIDQIINAELEERIFLRIDEEHQPRYLTMRELFKIEEHMERILASLQAIFRVQCPDKMLEAA